MLTKIEHTTCPDIGRLTFTGGQVYRCTEINTWAVEATAPSQNLTSSPPAWVDAVLLLLVLSAAIAGVALVRLLILDWKEPPKC